MWTDSLSLSEAKYTEKVLKELSSVHWANGLLSRIHKAGGLTSENMPLLFEARFAYELYRKGLKVEYEYPAGVGDSTVEFRVIGSNEWLIELVSIRCSEGVKRATKQIGPIYERSLSTNSSDPHQSEEAEMITAEQKIGEKVFAGKKPTKFPPVGDAYHLIVTDIRGYLDQGGDIHDYRHMAYGYSGIEPSEYKDMLIRFWEIKPGRKEPIKGLFEKNNPIKASKYIRERIHFIGFVREKEYVEGELADRTYYFGNPHLFKSNKETKRAYQTYPLAKEIKW